MGVESHGLRSVWGHRDRKVALRFLNLWAGGKQPRILSPCFRGRIPNIGKNERSMEHTLGFAAVPSSWVRRQELEFGQKDTSDSHNHQRMPFGDYRSTVYRPFSFLHFVLPGGSSDYIRTRQTRDRFLCSPMTWQYVSESFPVSGSPTVL